VYIGSLSNCLEVVVNDNCQIFIGVLETCLHFVIVLKLERHIKSHKNLVDSFDDDDLDVAVYILIVKCST
jgi:hypothetical protein